MAHTLTHPHVALSFTGLTDAERQSILSGIATLAPTSALCTGNASIQAGVADLVKIGTTLKQGSDTVSADRTKLAADIAVQLATRTSFDAKLKALATLVESAATTSSDLTSMGFRERSSAAVATAPLAAPSSIKVRLPKLHGVATYVTAVYAGSGRPHFVAESSPDPVGPTTWSALAGAGKTRALTGASGTRVWVRFASVRAGTQSDWCTPVLVTLP